MFVKVCSFKKKCKKCVKLKIIDGDLVLIWFFYNIVGK